MFETPQVNIILFVLSPLLIAWPSKLSFGGTFLALLELSLPSKNWVSFPPVLTAL